MQRGPRLRKKRQWFMGLVTASVLFLLITAAGLIHYDSHLPGLALSNITQWLHTMPLLTWLATLIPSGESPFLVPWSNFIIFVALFPIVLSGRRFYFHRERFKEEERARDLRDI